MGPLGGSGAQIQFVLTMARSQLLPRPPAAHPPAPPHLPTSPAAPSHNSICTTWLTLTTAFSFCLLPIQTPGLLNVYAHVPKLQAPMQRRYVLLKVLGINHSDQWPQIPRPKTKVLSRDKERTFQLIYSVGCDVFCRVGVETQHFFICSQTLVAKKLTTVRHPHSMFPTGIIWLQSSC